MTSSRTQRPLPYDESRFALSTAELIERRVDALVGSAAARQLWLMFLDGDAIQLPLIVPLDGFPDEPSNEWTAAIAALAGESAHEAGAASIVLVWERAESAVLTAADARWLRSLVEAFSHAAVSLAQIVLSHRGGVRLVASGEHESRSGSAAVRHSEGAVSSGNPESEESLR